MDRPFDVYRIAEEMEMEESDVLHLMRIYKEELTQDVAALDRLMENADWPEVRRLLHKMKGDASNMCLHPIHQLTLEMESAVLADRPETLPEKLEHLKRYETQFIKAFKDFSGDRR